MKNSESVDHWWPKNREATNLYNIVLLRHQLLASFYVKPSPPCTKTLSFGSATLMQKTLLHSKPDLVFLYHHNAVHTCLTNLPSYWPPHTQLQCPNPSPNQASPCFCSPQWFTSPQCLSLRLPHAQLRHFQIPGNLSPSLRTNSSSLSHCFLVEHPHTGLFHCSS